MGNSRQSREKTYRPEELSRSASPNVRRRERRLERWLLPSIAGWVVSISCLLLGRTERGVLVLVRPLGELPLSERTVHVGAFNLRFSSLGTREPLMMSCRSPGGSSDSSSSSADTSPSDMISSSAPFFAFISATCALFCTRRSLMLLVNQNFTLPFCDMTRTV